MQYHYYVLRTTKRMIDWFFDPIVDRIYCRTIVDVNDILESGDVIYALNQNGVYEVADSLAKAEFIHRGEWMSNHIPDKDYYHKRIIKEIIDESLEDIKGWDTL